LVSITGPAGIGKSRLAWELEKYLDGVVDTIYWHRGRCPAYGDGVTFWALGEMVRGRARLPENADEETTRTTIRATVAQYVGDESERDWIESALMTLLGMGEDGATKRELLFAAWRRFFENVAAGATTVLVFEDLQWADDGLLDFIDHLLDWSKSAPLLIVTLARPDLFDRRPGWGAGRRSFTALALDPLPEAAMREMLAGLVPDLPEPALRAIIGRADGIPLYAVEIVRMLLADGRLKEVEGTYRPTGELGDLAVPETLRSLIAARLDALDSADRRVLQDASVLGQSFSADALAGLTGSAPDELNERLRPLVRRELLTVEADPRSPERGQYSFVQSLIREVAYSTLTRPERRERHLAAARQLEAGGGEELAAVLAGHYVAAHAASSAGPEADAVAAQARVALRAAAERAAALAGHKQAATFLEQALELTSEPADRVSLLERLAGELEMAGRYDEGEAHLRAAFELLAGTGDTATEARLRGMLGRTLIQQGRVEDAISELETTLSSLPDDADPQVRADVLAKLARAYYRNLDGQRSLEVVDRALVLAEHNRLLTTLGEAMVSKGTALQMVSRPLEALALYKAGLAITKREGDIQSQFRAVANMTGVMSAEEGAPEAFKILLDGLAMARAVGDMGMTVWLTGNLMGSAVFAGYPLDEALAQADELLALDLAESDRLHLFANYIVAGSFHGLDVSDKLRATADVVDPQQRIGRVFDMIFPLAAAGDWAAAARQIEKAVLDRPQLSMMGLAMLAAAVSGDIDALRGLIERGARMPELGRIDALARAAARNLLLAAEGQPGRALPGLREAHKGLREMSSVLYNGTLALAMLRILGPESPDARVAGEEALANWRRTKAWPLVEQVQVALDAKGTAPLAVTAGRPASEAEVSA
jgi:tetratricopeptide (TPR) repeat protein